MRINQQLLDELIANQGELRTGPISAMGVLRLALDLRDLRAPHGAPTFTHEELREIWSALSEYIENNETPEGDEIVIPPAADTANEKLDRYFGSL